jgi:hypothetical protein
MRDYAKLSPTFWTGATGKALRRRGSEAVIVAVYLMSSPHSNMLGLYYQPLMYMAHETGLGIEGASKGLTHCIECGFCEYDNDTEMVWVNEMAAWQISDGLSQGDKRCKGIQKDYDALPNNPFLGPWFDRYAKAFHLKTQRTFEAEKQEVCEGASQAPSKPHRSQEQEQEQEQEQKTPSSDPPGETATKQDARGTRIPEGWEPGPEGMAFAEQQGLRNGKAQAELAKFRDFWVAQPGVKGRKADWPATWRNWVRKACELAPAARQAAAPGEVTDLFRRGAA